MKKATFVQQRPEMEKDQAIREAYVRLSSYCARKERTLQEVSVRAASLGLDKEDTDLIVRRLKQEGFLDPTRYAAEFVLSRFRNHYWGKVKIREALLAKELEESLVEEALDRIDGEEYLILLEKLALASGNKPQLFQSLVRKGFEEELVLETLVRLKFLNTE